MSSKRQFLHPYTPVGRSSLRICILDYGHLALQARALSQRFEVALNTRAASRESLEQPAGYRNRSYALS